MEDSLFFWEDYDDIDDLCQLYFSITLKQRIGPHLVGTEFTCALLDLDKGLLTLHQGKTWEETYEISLVVGARI